MISHNQTELIYGNKGKNSGYFWGDCLTDRGFKGDFQRAGEGSGHVSGFDLDEGYIDVFTLQKLINYDLLIFLCIHNFFN